jgi:ubiquitin-protein ligase
MTPQEIRKTRLQSDYKEMCNIRGPIIAWEATRGAPPNLEAYRLTVSVRSIIGPTPTYRDRHVIDLTMPANYPYAPPLAKMVSQPGAFHPNWWPDKRWCHGLWDLSESLGHFIIRMIRTLQFDPIITNENSPANGDANDWYLLHRNEGLFPCDRQSLPDPTKSRFEIQVPVRKKFEVLR